MGLNGASIFLMKAAEKILKALANRKRLEALAFLNKTKTASVGEVAKAIKTSIKSTSKHLLILHNADFLEKKRVHGLTIYSLGNPTGNTEKVLLKLFT